MLSVINITVIYNSLTFSRFIITMPEKPLIVILGYLLSTIIIIIIIFCLKSKKITVLTYTSFFLEAYILPLQLLYIKFHLLL